MHQTIGRIIGKTDDYKICKNCDRINWYENEECINCQSKEFKKLTQKYANSVLKAYQDDEIEIDI